MSEQGTSDENIKTLTIHVLYNTPKRNGSRLPKSHPLGQYHAEGNEIDLHTDSRLQQSLRILDMIRKAPTDTNNNHDWLSKIEEGLSRLEETIEQASQGESKQQPDTFSTSKAEAISKHFVTKRLLPYLNNPKIPLKRKVDHVTGLSEIALRRYLEGTLLHELGHFLQHKTSGGKPT